MQADIEIQSAAKLPTRQVRRSRGTGARSRLYRVLGSSSIETSTSGASTLVLMLVIVIVLEFSRIDYEDDHEQEHESEMRRLALEEFSAAKFANEFSIARRELSANGHDVRPALDFHSFKRIVIEIHLVRFC